MEQRGGNTNGFICLAHRTGGVFQHAVSDLRERSARRCECIWLTVTYLVGALASGVLFFVTGNGASLLQEYGRLNWASFLLGLVIVGLEAGWIYAYKAGWPVSTAFIVQSAILAGFLLLVGYLLYHEPLAWNKIAGVVICLIGLYVMNYK